MVAKKPNVLVRRVVLRHVLRLSDLSIEEEAAAKAHATSKAGKNRKKAGKKGKLRRHTQADLQSTLLTVFKVHCS
jgi:hypothetical protein